MRRLTQQSVSRQRGAVLVEMALVTPIMLILLVAVADLTRAFVDHNTLTKAVRNGVRYVAANAYQGTTGFINLNATLVCEAQNLVVFVLTSPPGGTPARVGQEPERELRGAEVVPDGPGDGERRQAGEADQR